MNILCTPSGIADIQNPGYGIRNITDAGFDNILLDLSLCCPAAELENTGRKKPDTDISDLPEIAEHPEKMQEIMAPFLTQCKKNHIHIPVSYAPYWKRNTKRTDLNGLARRLAEESIKICGAAGCKYLIVRPLSAGTAHGDEWKVNKEYYLCLAAAAKQNNVMLLLENQCRDMNGHLIRGICSDAAEAAAWIDSLNAECKEERFGFCMDTGVCSICRQDIQDFILTLGNRIKAVILRDSDGQTESFMLPFTGVSSGQSATDWLGVIRGLREISFDGFLIMDFHTTAGAFSWLLRPQILRLAKDISEYFAWQIGMKRVLKKYRTRVLFGAGNMCRNFMKCYGEEFPPLFTCDNNKSRWGEQFEGLEIKPPEELKKLTPDCAVFICNIYYREIEQQLREMGISNPIEYFNDEYMPSYYTDKLEYWREPIQARV